MFENEPYELVIVESEADAGPATGARHGVFARAVTVGRANGADVCLDHPTVSHEHARLEPTAGGLSVVNLTRNGTTVVDGVRLEPGARAHIPREYPYVQIGAFLIEVRNRVVTVPHHRVIAPPPVGSRVPVLVVELRDGGGRALARGQELAVTPRPLVVLAALVSAPNDTVPRETVHAWVSPSGTSTNLDPIVHRLRRALDAALDAGDLPRDAIVSSMARCGVEVAPDATSTEVVKALVRTERSRGYRLALYPDDVELRRRRIRID